VNNSGGVATPVQQAEAVASAPQSDGGMAAAKLSKKDKTVCFRCEDTSHVADTCSAILCIYCEKAMHDKLDCPLLSLPRPTVVTYGLCRPELIFHEIQGSDEIRFKHDSGKIGRISVLGGVMTTQEIIK
jgi:hypothetical protein